MHRLAILLIALLFSCNQDKKSTADNCDAIHRLAVDEFNEFQQTQAKEHLHRSLKHYDDAIGCDETRRGYYQGKLTVLSYLNDNKESLTVLTHLFDLSQRSDAECLVAKGIIFEKMELPDSSTAMYDQAFALYDRQLLEKPKDSLTIMCNRLYLTAVAKGKEVAEMNLKPYLTEYSETPEIKTCSLMLRDFDKNIILGKK